MFFAYAILFGMMLTEVNLKKSLGKQFVHLLEEGKLLGQKNLNLLHNLLTIFIDYDVYAPKSKSRVGNCTAYSSYQSKDCECLQVYTFCFGPGTELKSSIESIVQSMNLQAVSIVTGVGSVNETTVSFVRRSERREGRTRTYRKDFNLNALSGTVSPDFSNLYVVLSDDNGHTKSGQLVSAYVLTSVEVVLLENYRECYNMDSDGGLGIDQRFRLSDDLVMI